MIEHAPRDKKPVEEGKEYTVTVVDIGSRGDGIAKVDGFIIFIPETKVGQTVKIQVTRVMNKSAFAKKIE
ncbi:MAG: TRAM domain-containing protein [Methanomassiliicoccales archaeon]|nr:TRAM domain-containing protein [Methanomassiliicoccales archaeon]